MRHSIYQHLYKIWLLSQLVEQRSFKKVAIDARMSVPALSQNIKALEVYFGKTLIVRKDGAVSLTKAGKEVLANYTHIIESIEEIDVGDPKDIEIEREISIGAYDSITINILPQLLPRLRNRYPKLKLNVETARSSALATKVRKGELDMALIVEAAPDDFLDVEYFASDYLGLFVSPRHKISSMGLQAIDQYGVGTISPGNDGYPVFFQRYLLSLKRKLPFKVLSDSFETIRSIALEGAIVGLLPYRVAIRYGDELVALPTGKPQGRHRLCLVVRKNIQGKLRNILIQEISEVFKTLKWDL